MNQASPGCLLAFLSIVALVLFSQFLGSDEFEKLIYPEKYWNNRVTTLQKKINNLHLQITQVSNGLKKNANIELQEMTLKYVQSGLPPDKATKLAAETLPKLIEVRKQLLEAYIRLMKKSNEELAEAKQKAEEYKKR